MGIEANTRRIETFPRLDRINDEVMVYPTSAAVLVNSVAYADDLVVKATPGILISVFGYNSGPSQFIQLHDATSLPADTAVPKAVFSVPATSNFSLDIPITGMPFATGIVVANSTTGPTLTSGADDCYFTAVRI